MISSEEILAKADFHACQLEETLGRKLSADEYSEYVWWFIQNWHRPPHLSAPNPIESGTID